MRRCQMRTCGSRRCRHHWDRLRPSTSPTRSRWWFGHQRAACRVRQRIPRRPARPPETPRNGELTQNGPHAGGRGCLRGRRAGAEGGPVGLSQRASSAFVWPFLGRQGAKKTIAPRGRRLDDTRNPVVCKIWCEVCAARPAMPGALTPPVDPGSASPGLVAAVVLRSDPSTYLARHSESELFAEESGCFLVWMWYPVRDLNPCYHLERVAS